MNLARGRNALNAALAAVLLLAAGCMHLPRGEAAEPSWDQTGSMRVARDAHTGTLLEDGRVLVAGGFDGDVLATTELYDPSSHAWRFTSPLTKARSHHTATRLADGRVLVVGGYGVPDNHLASCEVYDPATGAWSETGPLANGRHSHTAVLLEDGRVLVSGGEGPEGTLASTELYDPSSGVWNPGKDMLFARSFHRVTRLSDSSVLVTGGEAYGACVAPTEIFAHGGDTWMVAGSLKECRHDHSATLLVDGRVLVAGGVSGTKYLRSAELFDPGTGGWRFTGFMNEARGLHEAVLLVDGTVLIPGGEQGSSEKKRYLKSSETYDPVTETCRLVGSLHAARARYSLTLLGDGSVLVAGGYEGNDVIQCAERFDAKPMAPYSWEKRETVRDRIVGTWTLLSYGFRVSDGEILLPFGEDVVGILRYGADGTMEAQLMRRGRARFGSGDHFGGTDEEVREAFEGYFAYFGRYEIDEMMGTVTHHVDGSLLPNWVGTDQVRAYEFSGDRLILRSEEDNSTGYFIWESLRRRK